MGGESFRFLVAVLIGLCIMNEKAIRVLLVGYFWFLINDTFFSNHPHRVYDSIKMPSYDYILILVLVVIIAVIFLVFYILWKKGPQLVRLGLISSGIGVFVRCLAVMVSGFKTGTVINELLKCEWFMFTRVSFN
jgi:hypothetical protein